MLIIAWILLFMVLVIIHELGHFRAAKKSWVQVIEFGIGIPPKLFTIHTDKSGTEYTINLIPLGGFVRLKGEDPKDEGTFKAKDSFIMATFIKKAIILLGGVTMNFIAAYLIFAFGFWHGSKPITVLPSNAMVESVHTKFITTYDQLIAHNLISGDISEQTVSIKEVAPDSLASKAWLKAGDQITMINGSATNTMIINRQLKESIWKTAVLNIIWSWTQSASSVTITCPQDACVLGIMMDSDPVSILPYKYPLGQSLVLARDELIGQSKLSFKTLGNLFGSLLSFDGEKINAQTKNLTWPAGAVKIGEMIYQAGGWVQFLLFGALISLSLAIFNVLPIPALDGGRLLWVIIQTIWRFKPEKYFVIENYFNMVFFFALMGVGILMLFRDLHLIWKIF